MVPQTIKISKQFIDELILWNEISKQINKPEPSVLGIRCADKNNKQKRQKNKGRKKNDMT